MKRYITQMAVTGCLFLFMGFCIVGEERPSVNPPQTSEIGVEQIGRDVFIRGRLGKRLGEFSTVVGQWVRYHDDKRGRWTFCVMEVDGAQLANPIGFAVVGSGVEPEGKPRDGEMWMMRCFEDASFTGTPDQYRAEFPGALGSGGDKWQFQSRLHYVKREVRERRGVGLDQ